MLRTDTIHGGVRRHPHHIGQRRLHRLRLRPVGCDCSRRSQVSCSASPARSAEPSRCVRRRLSRHSAARSGRATENPGALIRAPWRSKLGRAGAVRRLAALARQHQHHVGLARIAGRLAHRQALQGRAYRRVARRAARGIQQAHRTDLPLPVDPQRQRRGRRPARWPAAGTGRPARAAAAALEGPAMPRLRRHRAAGWRWARAAARKPCRRPPARSGPCPPATDAAPRPAHNAHATPTTGVQRPGPIHTAPKCPSRCRRLPAPRADPGRECRTPAAHPRARRPAPPTAPPTRQSAPTARPAPSPAISSTRRT